ncbi:hypothetical protein KFK09_013465 [Dendrobium nobile]|uniref:MULE transposase domain-containing protein n=1 Tax=Dendrobium nobile TaxID=94219 RepID=A0A8T3B7F5_DENNO|nr:hypothetical protein KFK09_013465 [Dendrobium nobile]
MSRLMLFFGGELRMGDEFTATYIGGQNRPIIVDHDISLTMLKERVMGVLRINPSTTTVSLTCRLRHNGGHCATPVNDEEVCEFMLLEARIDPVVVYVEAKPNNHGDVAGPSTEIQIEPSLFLMLPSIRTKRKYFSLHEDDIDNNDEDSYKTMDSGSSDTGDSSSQPDTELQETMYNYTNNENIGDEFIQEHARRNVAGLQSMDANNNFEDTFRTTEEWDGNEHCDPPIINIVSSTEATIPSEVYEGQIFHNKEDLQAAINGWSIAQNVQHIMPIIKQQLDMKPKEIIARMESKFEMKISYMKAWDARRKAIEAIFGSYEESYRSVLRFMEVLRMSQPGTVYNVDLVGGSRFKAIFWAFSPSINGWQHCRPVLSLDGTFLLGKYCGTLLAAVGIDVNGGLFPLAFAIVESESNDSWVWFLRNLHNLVEVVKERQNLCIISDKHAGLVRGCHEIFPQAVHRHCLRHLRENFKKFLRRQGIVDVEGLCNNMYLAGSTEDSASFTRMMEHIKNAKQEAYDWLIQRDVSKWSLLFDNGCRYSIMTTNASECFNGVLKRARGLPIQGLVMSIYYNLVSLFMRRSIKLISG